MTDSIRVFPPGFRVTDSSGDPVSQAKIKFYDAGTTTPKTVYSNSGLSSSLGSTVYCGSDGFPVASLGSSTEVAVHTGTASFKITITDLDDVEIITLDNLTGAIDTSTFLTSSDTSTLSVPVITKTANYTLAAADRGKLVQGNTTGGNFTLTLTAAATLGDGWNCEIRNSGTSGQLILSTSDTVSFEGQTFTLRAFEIGEGAAIRCNGTGFELVGHTPPLMSRRGPGVIIITDRITSAPVSPTPGARYIVTSGFSTYSTHDIIESNGTSYNKYTPATDAGWIAFVQDENRYYHFEDSAWVLGVEPTATSTVAGLVQVSTQALMETGTATDTAVLIGHQKYHPGASKLWFTFNGSGTPAFGASVNCASITDNGVGDWTVNFTTSLSSTSYAMIGWARTTLTTVVSDAGVLGAFPASTKSAGAFQLKAFDGESDAAIDCTEVNGVVFGDFA